MHSATLVTIFQVILNKIGQESFDFQKDNLSSRNAYFLPKHQIP